MEGSERTSVALRMGIYAAFTTIIGILLSGPVGILIVETAQPSPPWQDAATYARNFHPIQTFPFFCGFLLVVGYVMLIAALHGLAEARQKSRTLVAVMLTSAFSALIALNYINQTTFVPAMARNYQPTYDAAITAFSLSNPNSLGWALEMWGYGFLGLATWFAAPVFNRNRLEKTVAGLMILNGVLSVTGALVTAFDLDWVMTPPGIAAFAAWNVVVFVLSVCALVALRRRQRESA